MGASGMLRIGLRSASYQFSFNRKEGILTAKTPRRQARQMIKKSRAGIRFVYSGFKPSQIRFYTGFHRPTTKPKQLFLNFLALLASWR
jgi:hypothetical protein